MRLLTLLLPAVVGLKAVHAQAPPPGDYMHAPVCAGLDNTFRCARAVERDRLRVGDRQVVRDGVSLALHVQRGSVHLTDNSIPEGVVATEPAAYSYFGVVPGLSFYLVHAQYAEGNDFLLVHQVTGRLTRLEGPPLPSPNRHWMLSAESGYFNQIGVFLYRVSGDSLLSALRITPSDWVPGAARWESSSLAVIDRLAGTEYADSIVGRLELRLANGTWTAVVQ